MQIKSGEGEQKRGKIIVFSAASGAGKTTILDYLREVMPELVYSISVTTREPRVHEKDGIHYFFIDVEEFKRKIKEDKFAEWAEVHGNYYGTPKEFIEKTIESGKTIIMDIDVYGKVKFDKVYPEALGIFLIPPSNKELERRLRSRKTDSEEVINIRLNNAKKEMEFAKINGKYEYSIINNRLDQTRRDVVTLIKKIIKN